MFCKSAGLAWIYENIYVDRAAIAAVLPLPTTVLMPKVSPVKVMSLIGTPLTFSIIAHREKRAAVTACCISGEGIAAACEKLNIAFHSDCAAIATRCVAIEESV